MIVQDNIHKTIRESARDNAAYLDLIMIYNRLSHITASPDSVKSPGLNSHFLDAVPTSIIITDASPDQLIVFVNRAFEEKTGYLRDEVINRNPRFLQADDRNQADRVIFREAIENSSTCKALLRNYRKNGEMFWNEVFLSPLFDEHNRVTHFMSIQIDVTNRILSQIELDENIKPRFEKYRQIFYGTSDSIVLFNRDYECELVNDVYLDRRGLTREDIEGKHLASFMGEDVFQNILKPRLDQCLNGELVSFVEWFTFDSGQKLLLEVSYQPLRHDNEIIGIIANTRDITDLHEIQAALAEPNLKYQTLFNSIDQGFCVCELVLDNDGQPFDYRYLEVNSQFEKHTGIIDPIGKTAKELVPGLEEKWVEILGKVVLDRQANRFEQGSDALGRWYQAYAFPYDDENYLRFAVLFSDITDKKQAEKQLHQLQSQYKALINNVPDGMVALYGHDLRYKLMTGLGIASAGMSGDDFIGKRLSDVLPPEVYERDEPKLIATLKGEITDTVVEHNGEHFRVITVPVLDDNGKVDMGLVMSQNVSSMVAVEEALRKSKRRYRKLNAELEAKVREQTAELNTFTYTVAHDLRAPLRAIDGYAYLLNKSLNDNLSDKNRKYIEHIRKSAQQMDRLILHLLEFTRLSTRMPHIQKISMTGFVQNILSNYQDEFLQKNVTVHLQDLPDNSCDEEMLTIVFNNLIDNALKFTSEQPEPEIRISAHIEDNTTIYSISDNGIGFDDKFKDKIFDVFERLHVEKDYEGFGIGLAIARRIIQKHGGRIWAESNIAMGARFHFTLRSSMPEEK